MSTAWKEEAADAQLQLDAAMPKVVISTSKLVDDLEQLELLIETQTEVVKKKQKHFKTVGEEIREICSEQVEREARAQSLKEQITKATEALKPTAAPPLAQTDDVELQVGQIPTFVAKETTKYNAYLARDDVGEATK